MDKVVQLRFYSGRDGIYVHAEDIVSYLVEAAESEAEEERVRESNALGKAAKILVETIVEASAGGTDSFNPN